MVKFIKAFLFKKPTATTIRQEMVEDYERQLLQQESLATYHEKMVEFYKVRIAQMSANNITKD